MTWWHRSSQDSQLPQYISKGPAETHLKSLAHSRIKVTRKTPAALKLGWGWFGRASLRLSSVPIPRHAGEAFLRGRG